MGKKWNQPPNPRELTMATASQPIGNKTQQIDWLSQLESPEFWEGAKKSAEPIIEAEPVTTSMLFRTLTETYVEIQPTLPKTKQVSDVAIGASTNTCRRYCEGISIEALNKWDRKKSKKLARDLTKAAILNIKSINNFKDFYEFIKDGKPQTSCLGGRYVYIPAKKDTLNISEIAARAMELMDYNPHFDENERKWLSKITDLISKFYSKTSETKMNWFQYLVFKIRSFADILFKYLTGGYSFRKTEKYWFGDDMRGGYQSICIAYTDKQLKETFDKDPPTLNSRFSDRDVCHLQSPAPFVKNKSIITRWKITEEFKERWQRQELSKYSNGKITFEI